MFDFQKNVVIDTKQSHSLIGGSLLVVRDRVSLNSYKCKEAKGMAEVEHTLFLVFSSVGAPGKNFKSTESFTRPAVSSVLSFNSSNLQVI